MGADNRYVGASVIVQIIAIKTVILNSVAQPHLLLSNVILIDLRFQVIGCTLNRRFVGIALPLQVYSSRV